MKSIYKSIPALALSLCAAAAFTACQDDFENRAPAFEEPVADHQANMTLMELKTLYWDDADNYIDTIGHHPQLTDEHIYVKGRVISNDSEGNIFKSLIISDGTAALAFSINQYDLYLQYRPGQEIVLDATGMYIGKYNGLQQMGLPEWYEKGSVWEATFMPVEFFRMHAQLNGFPEPEKIDTLTVSSISDLSTTPDGLRYWQSRLVRFNNVSFQNANGTTVFSEYKSSGVNQPIVDSKGSTLNVRTSGYSNFWNNPLPQGNGDVVGILSYYNNGWQLLLNDLDGCMNFGNPTLAPGEEDNPCTIDQAIALINQGSQQTLWIEGYIVGAVGPEVTSVTSNNQIEWTDKPLLNNTLVIGQTPDTRDIDHAIIVELPQGSALRQYGNLADNPANYKKRIALRGRLGKYMDAYGLLGNPGTASQFSIEGLTIDDGSVAAGDGSEAKPYNVGQVVALNPTSTTEAVASGVWVSGYIVGFMPTGGSSTTLSGAVFSNTPDPATTNIVLGPTADCTDYTQCIGIQLPSGAVRTALSLATAPNMLGAKVSLKGDVMKYCGGPGLKNTSAYNVIDGGNGTPNTPDTPDTPTIPAAGSGTAADPYNVAKAQEVIAAGGTTDKVYVKGIISQIDEVSAQYGNATYFISDDGTKAGQLEVFRGYYLGGEKFTSDSQIKVGDKVVVYGQLVMYYSTPEVTQGSQIYSLNGSESGSTPDTPDTPITPGDAVDQTSADFSTFNNGESNKVSYATYTTKSGWTATWALVRGGGEDDTNFISTDPKFLFPVLDGTPARPGKLTSPLISGGIKTLTFNYGFPYNETKVGFTVNIIKDGKVVATKSVVADPATKATVFTFSEAFNVEGDFRIEIVNDLITQSKSNNKDRVAIWNLSWTR